MLLFAQRLRRRGNTVKGSFLRQGLRVGRGQAAALFNLGSLMIVFFVAFSVVVRGAIFLGAILFYTIEDDASDALLR